jgi:hypothetical protein
MLLPCQPFRNSFGGARLLLEVSPGSHGRFRCERP